MIRPQSRRENGSLFFFLLAFGKYLMGNLTFKLFMSGNLVSRHCTYTIKITKIHNGEILNGKLTLFGYFYLEGRKVLRRCL